MQTLSKCGICCRNFHQCFDHKRDRLRLLATQLTKPFQQHVNHTCVYQPFRQVLVDSDRSKFINQINFRTVHQLKHYIQDSPQMPPNDARASLDSNESNSSIFPSSKSYQQALEALNQLESNRSVIQAASVSSIETQRRKVQKNREMLRLLNVTDQDLKRMHVVHVAGTKGKGSTCAMTESILRNAGYRTGMFVSPHLMSVRERIQLNGCAINETMFARYFWEVYEQLKPCVGTPDSKLFYFSFLNLMALYIFKHERVTAAIVEVGIGGEFDCTNIIDNPLVTAVSSLGIDHTSLLGDTIESIAWHKAGIFKPSVPAFTACDQSETALKQLQARAVERQCSLHVVPKLEKYQSSDENGKEIQLALDGEVQKVNASLALQLSQYFIQKVSRAGDSINVFIPSNEMISLEDQTKGFKLNQAQTEGLKCCRWAGRFQTYKLGPRLTVYLDGAHTPESIAYCAQWFDQQTIKNDEQKNRKRVLVFYCTGGRNASTLMSSFGPLHLDTVHLCPPVITAKEKSNYSQNSTRNLEEMSQVYRQIDPNTTIETHSCLNECFDLISNENYSSEDTKVDLLVTGSMILVGGWLKIMTRFSEN